MIYFVLLLILLILFYFKKPKLAFSLKSKAFKNYQANDKFSDTILKTTNNQTSANNQANANKPNTLKLKKAHIPLKVCMKLAFKNIWKKKFRFLIVIVISCISLAFLSFTIELNGDKLRQNIYTMIENGYNYTDILEYVPLDKAAQKEDFYNKYNGVELSSNSYNKIKEELPGLNILKYENVNINYANKNIDQATSFYPGYIQTLIEFDRDYNYELLAGKVPDETRNEILITDYLVYAFNHFDTVLDDGSYYDYLYKEITLKTGEPYKIVGILKTNFDNWISETGYKNGSLDSSKKENYAFYNDFMIMNSVVIPKSGFEKEKINTSGITNFTKKGENRSDFLVTLENNAILKSFTPHTLSITDQNLKIAYISSRWYNTYLGSAPNTDSEIAIPKTWVKELLGVDFSKLSFAEFDKTLRNNKITITITPASYLTSYTKTFTITGIVDDDNICLVNADALNIINEYQIDSEKVLVNLPNSGKKTLDLFNEAYKKGYILDVWKYHTDIDSYVVDPFIDLISKAGLIVFVAFTIGIMWTIITIEIVDSKKEIGILRSIGLSGFKVSSIFIIQSIFVNLIAYGCAIFIANGIINFYNAGITDELNVITLYMYTMTYRTPVYLLIFVFVITLISTILPLRKIMSQKIIDVINERE